LRLARVISSHRCESPLRIGLLRHLVLRSGTKSLAKCWRMESISEVEYPEFCGPMSQFRHVLCRLCGFDCSAVHPRSTIQAELTASWIFGLVPRAVIKRMSRLRRLVTVRRSVFHHLPSPATATESFGFRIRHLGAGDRRNGGPNTGFLSPPGCSCRTAGMPFSIRASR
jgi:hypothetical protein